jgi:hypothetical protein
MGKFLSYTLHNLPLLVREPVELVNQFVDLRIRRCNLSLDQGLLLVGPGIWKVLTCQIMDDNSR